MTSPHGFDLQVLGFILRAVGRIQRIGGRIEGEGSVFRLKRIPSVTSWRIEGERP